MQSAGAGAGKQEEQEERQPVCAAAAACAGGVAIKRAERPEDDPNARRCRRDADFGKM